MTLCGGGYGYFLEPHNFHVAAHAFACSSCSTIPDQKEGLLIDYIGSISSHVRENEPEVVCPSLQPKRRIECEPLMGNTSLWCFL